MSSVTKIRPRADYELNHGNDGRDAYYEVVYYCSGCGRRISYRDIACDKCGTFHDWSKKAKIVVRHEIKWE